MFYPSKYIDTRVGAGVSIGSNGVSVYEYGDAHFPAVAVYSGEVTGITHVIVEYIDRQPFIYINGVLVRIGLKSNMTRVWSPIIMGAGPYGAFDGCVIMARIYNRVLSQEEKQINYQAGFVLFSYPIIPYHITTGDNQIDCSEVKKILNIMAVQIEPEGTLLRYLVSFDNKGSWLTYNTVWQEASLDDIDRVGMTADELNTVDWNYFQPGVHGNLNIAVALATIDISITPSVSKLLIEYVGNLLGVITRTTIACYINNVSEVTFTHPSDEVENIPTIVSSGAAIDTIAGTISNTCRINGIKERMDNSINIPILSRAGALIASHLVGVYKSSHNNEEDKIDFLIINDLISIDPVIPKLSGNVLEYLKGLHIPSYYSTKPLDLICETVDIETLKSIQILDKTPSIFTSICSDRPINITVTTDDYTRIDTSNIVTIKDINKDYYSNGNERFLFSFDNRNTWYSYDYSTNQWVIVSLDDIQEKGMTFWQVSSIPEETWSTKLSEWLDMAIRLIAYPSDSNETIYDFTYTGNYITWIAPFTGDYRLEVWGAEGGLPGGSSITGGLGGYTKGTITLTQGDILYICIGGYPGRAKAGGWNGGGNGGTDTSSSVRYGGGGGGATDIRVGDTSLSNRIIIAGGGGGGGEYGNSRYGAGGEIQAQSGAGQLTTNPARTGAGYQWSWGGGGGSQTQGGVGAGTYVKGGNGTLYQGGAGDTGCCSGSGGGGGGYYGGAAGGNDSPHGSGYSANGGGGSSYTDGVSDGTMQIGVQAGNGKARITLLNTTMYTVNGFTFRTIVNKFDVYQIPMLTGFKLDIPIHEVLEEKDSPVLIPFRTLKNFDGNAISIITGLLTNNSSHYITGILESGDLDKLFTIDIPKSFTGLKSEIVCNFLISKSSYTEPDVDDILYIQDLPKEQVKSDTIYYDKEEQFAMLNIIDNREDTEFIVMTNDYNRIDTRQAVAIQDIVADYQEIDGIQIRFLLSFNNRETWYIYDHDTSSWIQKGIDNIHNTGMTFWQLKSIPRDAWHKALTNWLNVCVGFKTFSDNWIYG